MGKLDYSGEEPLNREPDIEKLLSSYITHHEPYDRNHGPIPLVDTDTHSLTIDGRVVNQLSLSIAQLREDYPQHRVVCAMQCAGNRRHTMRTQLKEVQGVDWFDGAVMNCVWKGPRLRDVLMRAGLQDDLRTHQGSWTGHVAFACHEVECQDDKWYGGSIPLGRALDIDSDCILALDMNGKPLTAEHGGPVRALCPGILGARSVKWLNQITLQLDESSNFYQQHDYKILPPEALDVESAKPYWDKVAPMCDMPINSIIGLPRSSTTVQSDADSMVVARGYALPAGANGPIKFVEVSGDGGKTWAHAALDFGDFADPLELETEAGRRKVKWAWCLWTAKVKVERGLGRRIISRAIDYAGNVQPEHCPWNLRGVGYNAWGESRDLTIL